ncbi:ABC transporter ATP-binding protein [Bacillus thuringiensis]|uniref:ABC transporter ATP-binding protein n=1 Tax=Bacillus thuringiensis TaxID=1428 RepID=UPI0020C2C561|nr:ABC transporter ATP-binding protein [Bacillus thuringiensis]
MDNKNSLMQLIKKIEWPKRLIILSIIISSLSSLVGLFIPFYTGKLVDGFSEDILNSKFITLFVIVFLLNALLGGLGLYLLSKVGEQFIYSIRKTLTNHILHLKLSFFDNTESGNIISRVTDDTNVVNNFLTQKFPSVLPSLISLIGSLIMLLILDWKTTILTLVLIPIMFLIMTPLSKIVQKVSFKNQNEMADFNGNFNRVLNEIRLVKTSVTEEKEFAKISDNLNNIFLLGLQKAKIFSVIQPISGLLILLTIGCILGFGGVRVSTDEITTGVLISMIFYVIQLTGPLANLSAVLTEYQEANGASTRIADILKIEKEEYENEINNTSIEPMTSFADLNIKFENIQSSYSEEKVLKNISFEIPHNKTTAIVGPSGSGKTTILNLLERLYPIEGGDIKIGNQSIYDFPLNVWRNQLGYVMQNNTLMNGTIRENILYGITQNVSDEKLIYYSKLANCYDFIMDLENQFDTQVGERGLKLSVGQAQRINIARNFIKNPHILLLDEATASLDSESEQKIHDSLNNLLSNKTTIIIAHRLSTIRNADNIIFLENGKITGQGTHEELMLSHKKYNYFVNLQDSSNELSSVN